MSFVSCDDCAGRVAISLLIYVHFHRVPSPEPPQFIKEPVKHITAEMEKVVDIPCQARGE